MENFLSLKLEQILMDSIAKINFKTPTPIQAEAIPVALEGKDILGTAQTGTGKTAAFGIPLINFLLKTKKDTALVMTPTRELATQVMQTMTNLIGRGNIRTALLIGGDSAILSAWGIQSVRAVICISCTPTPQPFGHLTTSPPRALAIA